MAQPPHSKDKPARRAFLFLLPIGVLGAACGTIIAAAFRFLRPGNSAASEKWLEVAPLSELKGDKPILRKVVNEETQGWARMLAEQHVYVLPAKNNQVLSAVCPHEGCEVAWASDTGVFLCPCHDSSFAADGSQIKGPARRGLDPLPARVENGILQVQYHYFVNNIEERITRG
jgi:Rieske Fe-S protein